MDKQKIDQRVTLPDQILSLSKNNPIVLNCLMLYYRGEVTYTQALERMVIMLGEQDRQLNDMLANVLRRSAVPFSQWENK